jgi:hypothetical protein
MSPEALAAPLLLLVLLDAGGGGAPFLPLSHAPPSGFAAGPFAVESSSSSADAVDSSADVDVSVPVEGLAQAAASMRSDAERTYAKFFIGEPPARLSATVVHDGSGS